MPCPFGRGFHRGGGIWNNKMKTTLETITPKLAAEYLATMPEKQRPFRKQWAANLAYHIKHGTWHVTHQGIAFDTDGALFDGQHRLNAVIIADKSAKMMVTRGVTCDAWHATDIGNRRSYQDITGINKKLIEPMRLAFVIAFSNKQPAAEEIIEAMTGGLGKSIIALHERCNTSATLFSAVPVRLMASLYHAISGEDYTLDQYRALVLSQFDLMTQSVQSFYKQRNSGAQATDKIDVVCRAWRAFDPAQPSLTKISIKNHASILEEIRPEIRRAIHKGTDAEY